MRIPTTTLEVNGLRFVTRPGTSDAAIVSENVVVRPILKHAKITPQQKWIDVGGYIGTFACFLMNEGAAGVYSIEPNPENYLLHVRNRALNNFPIHILCAATTYSPIDHISNLTVGFPTHEDCATLFPHWKKERPSIPVAVVGFDNLRWAAVRTLGLEGDWCLKMDAQGAEIEILEQADLNIFKLIYFEYHFCVDRSVPRARRILERLEKLKFKVITDKKLPNKETWDVWPDVILGWAQK